MRRIKQVDAVEELCCRVEGAASAPTVHHCSGVKPMTPDRWTHYIHTSCLALRMIWIWETDEGDRDLMNEFRWRIGERSRLRLSMAPLTLLSHPPLSAQPHCEASAPRGSGAENFTKESTERTFSGASGWDVGAEALKVDFEMLNIC